MHRKLSSLLAAFVALIILGCSGLADLDITPEPPPSVDYVGTWSGPGMTLEISGDGTVHLVRGTDGSQTELTVPAQTWAPDKIEIGVGAFVTGLSLDQAPYREGNAWHMVVDGVPLSREADDLDFGEPDGIAPDVEPIQAEEVELNKAAAP